jgi:hypothetical protein
MIFWGGAACKQRKRVEEKDSPLELQKQHLRIFVL